MGNITELLPLKNFRADRGNSIYSFIRSPFVFTLWN